MASHVANHGLGRSSAARPSSSARCSRGALAVTCSSVRPPVLRPFSGTSSSAAAARRGPQQQQQQQQLWAPKAAEEPGPTDALAVLPDPDTAKEAIELGNKYAAAKRWNEALAIFEKALSLPGTGLKRYRDKPRLASDGEKQAALYNCACCHSQLGDIRSGLVALAAALEGGYDDFAQLRRDPDLEALRQDARFEGLVGRFEPKAGAGLLGFNLNNLFGR